MARDALSLSILIAQNASICMYDYHESYTHQSTTIKINNNNKVKSNNNKTTVIAHTNCTALCVAVSGDCDSFNIVIICWRPSCCGSHVIFNLFDFSFFFLPSLIEKINANKKPKPKTVNLPSDYVVTSDQYIPHSDTIGWWEWIRHGEREQARKNAVFLFFRYNFDMYWIDTANIALSP